MATHKSAAKRARQTLKRTVRNSSRKTKIKTSVKKLLESVKGNDKKVAEAALKQTTSVIFKAMSKGVLHKKTASRKVARLSKKVHSLAS